MEAVRTHQVLRDEVASRAGVDRSRLLFKVVQAWFNVQTGRVQSRFKLRGHEDLGYVAGPPFPLDEAERPMAPAGRDRMTASAGYRHGRRRRCGFSDCSGSCGLRRPQNRSDCWPPSNRNPRWRRTPCSGPPPASGCCRHEGTADSQPPQAPDANINAHVSNCTGLHRHRQNPARLSDNDDSPKQ
jgi:hypothetical protein